MTAPIAIEADDPADVELAGLPGAQADAAVVVRLRRGAAGDGDLTIRPAGSAAAPRVVGTGVGVWRRAPWPVRDELFDLSAGHPADGALVVGGDAGARAEVVGKLSAAGLAAREQPRLTAAGLCAAAVVVDVQGPGPLPVDAMAVLAARRVLVVGRATPSFGLLAGHDHLVADVTGLAVEHAISVLTRWEAFHVMRTWGALAAARHRASAVLPRLAAELLAEAAAEPR